MANWLSRPDQNKSRLASRSLLRDPVLTKEENCEFRLWRLIDIFQLHIDQTEGRQCRWWCLPSRIIDDLRVGWWSRYAMIHISMHQSYDVTAENESGVFHSCHTTGDGHKTPDLLTKWGVDSTTFTGGHIGMLKRFASNASVTITRSTYEVSFGKHRN